ncbi:DUF4426 domain-containing protein [Alteromonas antoniana]|uniref:DUF4426 domain-containing protein n=1 Tax=Alteromonas antoniana TaxID=2803813 RepID=UPI001C4507CB|nr:DUF4426 domain-containing protein [Alteromonas antoniana]
MTLLRQLAWVGMLLITFPALAEQKESLGDWDVHYMVVNTTFLTPEVASTYGIVRSKYNALVNISVLDKASHKAQRLSVSGEATNLLGNTRDLSFKKVEDGDAIYYLSVLPFRDQETFRFNIEIRKNNDSETLRFKQQMYTD